MDGYETDEILSQALDLEENMENDTIFITQSTFQNNEGILQDTRYQILLVQIRGPTKGHINIIKHKVIA